MSSSEPLDPDVGSSAAAARGRTEIDVLLVIAAGGALGSLGRWAVAQGVPHTAGQVAWSTVLVNVSGAIALGLLMAFVLDLWSERRLVRPFVGVGLLGGWTTFSTAMLDLHAMLEAGHAAAVLLYLGVTLVVGLAGCWVGLAGGRRLIARRVGGGDR